MRKINSFVGFCARPFTILEQLNYLTGGQCIYNYTAPTQKDCTESCKRNSLTSWLVTFVTTLPHCT